MKKPRAIEARHVKAGDEILTSNGMRRVVRVEHVQLLPDSKDCALACLTVRDACAGPPAYEATIQYHIRAKVQTRRNPTPTKETP